MSLRPRTLWILALIAILAALGIWQSSPEHAFLRRAWMLPLGVLALALCLEYWLTKRYVLRISRSLPQQIELGREFTYTLHAQIEPARNLTLEFAEYLPLGLHSEIGDWQQIVQCNPQGCAQHSQRLRAMALVPIEFGAVRARVLGVLGLAWWNREAAEHSRMQVVPQMPSHDVSARIQRSIQGISSHRRGQSFELHSLRDYQPGDAPRSIDWKASARSSQLKVRVMREEQQLELLIAVDVGRRSGLGLGEMRRFEHALNITARLAQFALARSDRVHVLAYADSVQLSATKLQGSKGVQTLHGILRQIQLQSVESNPDCVVHWVRQHLKQPVLICWLADTDGDIPAARLTAAIRSLRVHRSLVAGLLEPNYRAIAQHPQAHLQPGERAWLAASLRLSASHMQQLQVQALQSVRKAGAEVVIDYPNRIDASLLRSYSGLRARSR